jgi:hypothetical protein
MTKPSVHIDDAIEYIVRCLARRFQLSPSAVTLTAPAAPYQGGTQYDIEIKYVACEYWGSRGVSMGEGQTRQEGDLYLRPFFDAAWYLCRIAVLRPGETSPSTGIRGPGWNGDGFSITAFGREWLADSAKRPPTDPSRLLEIVQPFAVRFGPGFLQRGAEASSCYRTGNYLACCAMTGAAAESILLAVAIAKIGDEEEVLKEYRSSQGRRNITGRVVANVPKHVKDQFTDMTGMIHYWRDESAHGTHTTIGEAEAYITLSQLIRFAHLADDHWATLTRSSPP